MNYCNIDYKNEPELIREWIKIRKKWASGRLFTYNVNDSDATYIAIAKAVNNIARFKIFITHLSVVNNELIVRYRVEEVQRPSGGFCTQVAGYIYAVIKTSELCTLPIVFHEE